MFGKLSTAGLVLSIALIGADRVDLLGNLASFTLTPFLVFSSATLMFSALRTVHRGHVVSIYSASRRSQLAFMVGALLMLLFAFLSIPCSLDPTRSTAVFVDLVLVVLLSYSVCVLLLCHPRRERVLLHAVSYGLIVYILFCVGQFIAWSRGNVFVPGMVVSWKETMFAPLPFGPWVPRLSGATVDPNRAGFILLVYLVFLDHFTRPSRYTRFLKILIIVLILLTISRSAALSVIIYESVSHKLWRTAWSVNGIRTLFVCCLICVLLWALFAPQISAFLEFSEVSEAVAAKMSMEEGTSGREHLLLIYRGLEVWSRSPQTVLTGIGLASAPRVLADIFQGQKHENFHSLYVTLLAELGLPSLLVMLFLFIFPLLMREGASASVLALMSFNVSYQSHLEPMFWLTLALCWAFPARRMMWSRGESTARGCRCSLYRAAC